MEQYGTERQCVAALEAAGRPNGFVCPHCHDAHHSAFERSGRLYRQCSCCRVQTTVTDWANRHLAADAVGYSDVLSSMKAGLSAEIVNYHAVRTGSGRAAALHPAFKAVNTVLGNLKTAIAGTYHAFDFVKHAHRHLAEVAFRFNRRFDIKSILGRLIRATAKTRAYPIPCSRSGWRRFTANHDV
jgi:hypothetical protein